ncbi:hypothetical protein ACHAW5_004802 [Stephanodiscus triporus]|uniref:Uncharacterized protein n=1 Tax=Stephanodiscus triporus TaxID=2934178 RepID=A0ABD3MKV1_9STRA
MVATAARRLRPIARSVPGATSSSGARDYDDDDDVVVDACGVPAGHRHPIAGVHWYPGDVRGSFVSVSMSGEVLVWDATSFVPAFATNVRTHHSTAAAAAVDGGRGRRSTVADVRCTDVPKTPEGCPNGTALLALGIGEGIGGVGGGVRLCDAFRGGTATHELTIGGVDVGGGGGGGGVNAVAWDPRHPFRLASGDDDGAVRLWDVRKAGRAGCVGVLDRHRGGNDDDDDYGGKFSTNAPSSRRRTRGAESHSGPVAAVTFSPDGDEVVTSGLDGVIRHWDLRPESCFVSSVVALGKGGREGGIVVGDPSVAVGGRLLPTRFASEGRVKPPPGSANRRRRRRRHNLAIIQPGSRTTATLVSTANDGTNSSRGRIVGYSLYGTRGKEPGGCPSFVLGGHLAEISCLVPIVGIWGDAEVGGRRDAATSNQVNFLTGGMDGMILSWGGSHASRVHDVDYHRVIDRRSFRGYASNRHRSPSTHEVNPYFEDVDTW